MPCDSVARKSALIPMVSNAVPGVQWALVGAKRLVAVGAGGREAFGVRQLAAAFFSCPNNVPGTISARRRKQRVCPPMASFDRAADRSGFSRAAADALGVGGREALGVRQLAAAFFSCPNNVPGTISAWRRKQRVCPHVSIRGVPPQTSATAVWNKEQSEGHAVIRGQNSNTEPVTLFGSARKHRACHCIRLTPKAVLF